MTRKLPALPATRLRASPSFALAFSMDGRAYVAKETEPYIQYWLNERYRVLLSLFSGRGGATEDEALQGYSRLTGAPAGDAERKRLLKAVADMRQAGVLIGAKDDVSRYDARMAQDYLRHRPFPPEITQFLVATAPISASSRVLDLAGGPGALAVALARVSCEVSLMELSRGFVNAARARARQLGVQLTTIHESCNRLMFRDDGYDVVTVSQALHWLDDVLVCRGVCRVLQAQGSFFVISSSMDLDDAHPLSGVFGNNSVLGHKDRQSFAGQVQALMRRLTLLFDALDAPDVQRHDPTQQWQAPDAPSVPRIVPAGVSFFRQRRPFGMGYARAFLTPEHIRSTGKEPSAFWDDLQARCAAATPAQLLGNFDWAVLHFRRGGERAELPAPDQCRVVEIGWDGPPDS
jgi:ubiquinone/menaquinone biosynthesis C-methylase UbiE